nr:putative disease resistance protein At1g50180 isoform X2 [Ipomoea trifida]
MVDPVSTAINVAKLILEKIAPFVKDQIKLLCGLKEELTKLGDLVSHIAAVLLDAEGGQHNKKSENLLDRKCSRTSWTKPITTFLPQSKKALDLELSKSKRVVEEKR